MQKQSWNNPWILVYDGDPPADPPKTYTQDEVEAMVKGRLKKQKEKEEQLLTTLQELQSSTKLSVEEKELLQGKIDELETGLRTKEEVAARDKKKLEDSFKLQVDAAAKERDTWRNRYTESTIERALSDAAQSAEAVHSSQIVDLLKGNTRLVEGKNEDGTPNGLYTPFAKVKVKGQDGKPAVLDLEVSEAIKQMKSDDYYGNLFKSGASGGIGGGNVALPSTGDLTEMAKDTETYMKNRAKILGTSQ